MFSNHYLCITFTKIINSLKAIVYKSTGSWYDVQDEDGKKWKARILGKFKMDSSITSTNPIAVGDIVDIKPTPDEEQIATIVGIQKRTNYIVRTSPHNKNQQHIIASNIDQAMLIASIASPRTSLGFIDRFLITCELYQVPAVIVLNKIDLHTEQDQQDLAEWKEVYNSLGYSLLCISVEKQIGLQQIENLLKNKTTLLSGHSGVGKSSLINYLLPNPQLRTKEVSEHSGKGMHTTTFSEMWTLHDNNNNVLGNIIDTPGIKELGIVNVERTELSGYFRELKHFAPDCKYNNCMHINEPQCAVLQALENQEIALSRYQNYLNILESLPKNNYS